MRITNYSPCGWIIAGDENDDKQRICELMNRLIDELSQFKGNTNYSPQMEITTVIKFKVDSRTLGEDQENELSNNLNPSEL